MSDAYALYLRDCALERMPWGTRLDVEPFGAVVKNDLGGWVATAGGEWVEQEDLAQAIGERGCTVHARAE